MARRERQGINLDVAQQKAATYNSLAKLNSSFAAIFETFETLEQAGIIKPKYKCLFRGFTLELQAEINADILSLLHDTELADWARYGKIRQKWERYLKGQKAHSR